MTSWQIAGIVFKVVVIGGLVIATIVLFASGHFGPGLILGITTLGGAIRAIKPGRKSVKRG